MGFVDGYNHHLGIQNNTPFPLPLFFSSENPVCISPGQAAYVSTYLIIDLAGCQVMLLGSGGKLDVLQPAPDIWLTGINTIFHMAGPIQDLRRQRQVEINISPR